MQVFIDEWNKKKVLPYKDLSVVIINDFELRLVLQQQQGNLEFLEIKYRDFLCRGYLISLKYYL